MRTLKSIILSFTTIAALGACESEPGDPAVIVRSMHVDGDSTSFVVEIAGETRQVLHRIRPLATFVTVADAEGETLGAAVDAETGLTHLDAVFSPTDAPTDAFVGRLVELALDGELEREGTPLPSFRMKKDPIDDPCNVCCAEDYFCEMCGG